MLIAGFGMPGCGKSSIFRQLANLMEVSCYHEPEESQWPDAVTKRDSVGYVTAIQWFRSVRVPQLYRARAEADSGKTTLIDSYFDKLCVCYLGRPGMEWLVSRSDPYYFNLLQLAALDYHHLPDADMLILIEVSRDDYLKMLAQRGRKLDKSAGLENRYDTKAYYAEAAERYTSERSGQTRLVRHQNVYSSVEQSAHRLWDAIRAGD
jgi:hypothetical protein